MSQRHTLLTPGLVLWEMPLKETDKLLTILTPQHGKLTVRARGARRNKSRIAAASQLLAYSEMKLFVYKDHCTLDEAGSLAQFWNIRSDLALLALGSYFAELTRLVADADAPNAGLLSLLLNGLYALDTLQKPAPLVKAAFELRLLALSGYEPALSACAVCGNPAPETPMLHLTEGLLHCGSCAVKTLYPGPSAPLCAGSLSAMRYVLSAGPKRFLSFSLKGRPLERMGQATERFAVCQLDRTLPTLTYYHKMIQPFPAE